MRRIIPIVCTMLMISVIISYADNINMDTNMDNMVETNIVTPESEPELIPTPIPAPTPELAPIEESESTEKPIQEQEHIKEPEPEPVWWTDYDLDLLAAAIYYEAGSDYCTDEHQQLVAQIVVNRMNDARYPDTIYGVITDTKFGIQYSTSGKIIANTGNRNIITQRCYDNALAVLNGEIDCPKNVIFQANFKQGTGVYKIFETPYSTSYFCYG